MNGESDSLANLYQALADRCRKLEESHNDLKKKFESFSKEENGCSSYANQIYDNDRRRSSTVKMTSDYGEKRCDDSSWTCVANYRNVLQCMGHAVYVTRPGSGEIIYWNYAAEKLFGYKGNELFEKKFTSLHINEEYILLAKKIMDKLSRDGTWAGQFPLKKKTGEIFIALMTQSPLYEDGVFVGIITVSSDAAVFNSQNSIPSNKKKMDGSDDPHFRLGGSNLKRVSWDARPQITSFVSDLVHLKKRGDYSNDKNDEGKEENELEFPEIKCEKPPRIPVRKQIFQF